MELWKLYGQDTTLELFLDMDFMKVGEQSYKPGNLLAQPKTLINKMQKVRARLFGMPTAYEDDVQNNIVLKKLN